MHSSLAAHVTASNAALPDLQSSAGVASLNAEITRQATMVAYVDDYRLMAEIGLLCFALVLLLHQSHKRKTGENPAIVDFGHA
jgi:DHA2 family multidrug resistance protein